MSFFCRIWFSFVTILGKWAWKKFNKAIGREIGFKYFYSWRNKKIYIFPTKQKTRISVSVLARIEKDGKFLLKFKEADATRQDSSFKPLGGTIKLTTKMEEKLKPFEYDQKTRYASKNNDFRIFKDLHNNKIIYKVLNAETLNFYQQELKREICEEMRIKRSNFKDLFSFSHRTPFSVQPYYTEPDFSVIGEHDYVHHIIFNLKIVSKEKLGDLLSQREKVKWIALNGKENKSITSFIVNRKNKYYKFKEKA